MDLLHGNVPGSMFNNDDTEIFCTLDSPLYILNSGRGTNWEEGNYTYNELGL